MCVIVFSHNPLISTPQVSRYTYLIYITHIHPLGQRGATAAANHPLRNQPDARRGMAARLQQKKPYKTAAKSPQRPNGSAKRPVSQPKTARLAAPNSPFRSLKRPLSQHLECQAIAQTGRQSKAILQKRACKGFRGAQPYGPGHIKTFSKKIK